MTKQLSEVTIHRLKTVRDSFLLVLGIACLGVGFWDLAFPSSALSSAVIVIGSVGLSNAIVIVAFGLILTTIAVIMFARLRHTTVQHA